MKKSIIITAITLLCLANLKAQESVTPPVERLTQDNYLSNAAKQLLDKQRFLTEEYAQGGVFLMGDATKYITLVKYDAFKDDLYVKDKGNEIIVTKGNVDRFFFKDEKTQKDRIFRFIPKEFIYAEIIIETPQLSAYQVIKRTPPIKMISNQSGYHSQQGYDEKTEILWLAKGDKFLYSNKKKSILKFLSENFPEKKETIKKNLDKYKFSHQEDIHNFIKGI